MIAAIYVLQVMEPLCQPIGGEVLTPDRWIQIGGIVTSSCECCDPSHPLAVR